MMIVHVANFSRGHSSGFNKQIPLLVNNSKFNYVYNIGYKKFDAIDSTINLASFVRLLFQDKKVIVHFHSLLAFKSILIAAIVLFFKFRVVYSPRGEFRHSAILSRSSIKKLFFFWCIKPILRKSHLHFLSEVECAEYVFLNGLPQNFVVVPNAILDRDRFAFNYEFRQARSEFRILYVGRILIDLKNIRLLLSSYQDLQSRVFEVSTNTLKLQFIGTFGSKKDELEFWNLVRCHKLSDFIEIIGEIPNSEISEYMQNADLLYNLSFSEGFPNIVLEAMNAHLPVLCSHNTGIQHYFIQSEAVNFCSIASTDFVNKAANMLLSKQRRDVMQNIDISRFNPASVREELMRFYNKVC